MIENLFETWRILAKDEIRVDDRGILPMKDNGGCGLIHLSCIRSHEESMLQGYIQRCIHDRGWYWTLQQLPGYSKANVQLKIDGQPHQCGKETDACHEVLLTAYLQTLAAQRAIAPNSYWKHFKGDPIKVFCTAVGDLEAPPGHKDTVYCGKFRLEEDQTKSAGLFNDREGWFYVPEHGGDSSDRVFYFHDDIGYALKVDDFLGLVGAEHPEQEGLLRFVEVKSER